MFQHTQEKKKRKKYLGSYTTCFLSFFTLLFLFNYYNRRLPSLVRLLLMMMRSFFSCVNKNPFSLPFLFYVLQQLDLFPVLVSVGEI